MRKKCIVNGCKNKKSQGNFVGDLCRPCYKYITEGKIGPTSSLFGRFQKESDSLKKEIEETKPKVTLSSPSVWVSPISQTPYKCPVCEGRGIVPNGFYDIPNTQNVYTSSNVAPHTCKSCSGSGIIYT